MQSSTLVPWAEKTAKFVPLPSHAAPRGYESPSWIWISGSSVILWVHSFPSQNRGANSSQCFSWNRPFLAKSTRESAGRISLRDCNPVSPPWFDPHGGRKDRQRSATGRLRNWREKSRSKDLEIGAVNTGTSRSESLLRLLSQHATYICRTLPRVTNRNNRVSMTAPPMATRMV